MSQTLFVLIDRSPIDNKVFAFDKMKEMISLREYGERKQKEVLFRLFCKVKQETRSIGAPKQSAPELTYS